MRILFCLLLLGLTACGHKGQLYLPEEKVTDELVTAEPVEEGAEGKADDDEDKPGTGNPSL